MEILLTRHGQTEWNLLKKVQGKADIELNEKGIQQAEETRDSLKNEKIDLFIDDSIINCNKVSKLGIETILFNSKSNIGDKNSFYRVNDWKEIYEKIKNL